MKGILRHLFLPSNRNNHRSKLLHNSFLFGILFFIVLSTSTTFFVQKSHPEVLGISYSISSRELLILVNKERIKKNLNPLVLNSQLSEAAGYKADHMFLHNYWAHFAPDGTTPWNFIKGAGYNYFYAGENLAKGFTNSPDAVRAWMDSPSHRDNILSPQFKDVGFAIKEGNLQGEDTVLIVELFGSRSTAESEAGQDVSSSGAQIDQATPGIKGAQSRENSEFFVSPILDVNGMQKVIIFTILSAILIALLLDFIIVKKRRITRLVGNNVDHIILILFFIIFILVVNIETIL